MNPSYSGSSSRARTYDPSVNSRMLYHWAIEEYKKKLATSYLSLNLYSRVFSAT